MGYVDVEGFGKPAPIEDNLDLSKYPSLVFTEFDKAVTQKPNNLVKFEAINRKFNLGKLLMGLGINIHSQTIYCPFHEDKATGKKSAKYYPDTDKLYCFSETKTYSAYHALKLLYNKDIDEIFNMIWSSFSIEERREILDKFGEEEHSETLTREEESIFDKYKEALQMFKNQRINYHQMKNGLYKVFLELYNESLRNEALMNK